LQYSVLRNETKRNETPVLEASRKVYLETYTSVRKYVFKRHIIYYSPCTGLLQALYRTITGPVQDYYRPRRFQESEAPRFLDNWHMKVVRLSAARTGRLYSQEVFVVFIFVRAESSPGP